MIIINGYLSSSVLESISCKAHWKSLHAIHPMQLSLICSSIICYSCVFNCLNSKLSIHMFKFKICFTVSKVVILNYQPILFISPKVICSNPMASYCKLFLMPFHPFHCLVYVIEVSLNKWVIQVLASSLIVSLWQGNERVTLV